MCWATSASALILQQARRHKMFLLLAIILILLFGGGLFFHILGSFIYILLVLALASFVFHLITGRRA
jgi:uncharacterized membrane protein YedE/YeeE